MQGTAHVTKTSDIPAQYAAQSDSHSDNTSPKIPNTTTKLSPGKTNNMNETQTRATEYADYLMTYTLPMSSIPKRDPENIRQAIISLIRDGIEPATLTTELIRWPVDCDNISGELWKRFKDSAPRNFCPTCETEVELCEVDVEPDVILSHAIESLVDGKIYCSAKCLDLSIKQWDQ